MSSIFVLFLFCLYLKTNHTHKNWIFVTLRKTQDISYPNLNNFLYINYSVKHSVNNLVNLVQMLQTF